MDFMKPVQSRLSIIHKKPVGDATIISLDVEATGLDDEAEIIQIAALGTGKLSFFFDEYYSAPKGLGEDALAVNQITEEMIADSPPFKEGKALSLLKKLNTPDNIFVAHNAEYDLRMLRVSGLDIKMRVIDTMQVAHHLFPEASRVGLSHLFLNKKMYKNMDSLKKELFNDFGVTLETVGPHNALYDIAMLQILLDRMVEMVDGDIDQLVKLTSTPVILKKPLLFGKYKGSTVGEIAKIDKKYLQWCVSNMEGIDKNLEYTIRHYLKGGTGKPDPSATFEKPAVAKESPQIKSTLGDSQKKNSAPVQPVLDMTKL